MALQTGCRPRGDDRLVIGTTWDSDRLRPLQAELDTRFGAQGPAIRWVRLAPGDDLARFAERRPGVDVLLGGEDEAYDRMERQGLLASEEDVRRISLESTARSTSPGLFRGPRLDPRSLADAKHELSRDDWKAGYERMVLRCGSGGEIASNSQPKEGAAILKGCRHPESARNVLRLLIESGGAKPFNRPVEAASSSDGLLADLLRATLIDSRDELRGAWEASAEPGEPGRSRHWMCEPPPWPPASVSKIQSRSGDQAMGMVETLAGQLAPDPVLRSWLIRSWLKPPRLIDGTVLDEIAHAEDGRLIREPRLRSWLRAEWTAWARQRYRRVARQAALGPPTAETSPSAPSEGAAAP
jgi:hypothetical protein